MIQGFENRYSATDRALHRLAFRSAPLLVELADLEDRLFARILEGIPLDRPIFVTGLPRAGTTLLLELLVDSGAFASHTYRDMPFVLLPLLWNRVTARFRTSGGSQERAHGDGMLVGVDSPEAFEEMAWRAFWGSHYLDDRIVPWEADEVNEEFLRFFVSHIRKIVAVRSQGRGRTLRYASKNNGNIARLSYLRRALPEAVIVVPFREPVQQAASLLRQHRNFLKLHREDAFTRAYMAGIGHFDFGDNLKPVDFESWTRAPRVPAPDRIGFWIEYWIRTYRHLREEGGPEVSFVSYDHLCEAPEDCLGTLAEALELDDPERFLAQTSRIARAPSPPVDLGDVPPDLLAEATSLHEVLVATARAA